MLRSPTSSTGFAEVTGTSLKMGGDSGALETKTELGGITVGGEYTMGDMTFGVMGNFGTGDVEGGLLSRFQGYYLCRLFLLKTKLHLERCCKK